jgi:hypothetical protein
MSLLILFGGINGGGGGTPPTGSTPGIAAIQTAVIVAARR